MPEHIDQQPAKHTSGPWKITWTDAGVAQIYGSDHAHDRIATVVLRPTVANNITERDAHLIAYGHLPECLT